MSAAGWSLNLLYGTLLTAASPWLLYRRLKHGKGREGWRQKLLGDIPARPGARPCVWFHAVSVGEVLLLKPVIERLQATHDRLDVVISTTTETGQAVAREKYPFARIIYYPFDFTWSVRRALRRIRPDLVALVELELWPNFMRAVEEAGIPLVLLNGRLSERSFRGYRRIAPLVKGWLRAFTVITAQTEEYAERLLALGAAPERVVVTGSVKFDGLEHRRENPRTLALARAFGLAENEQVFIAGSTQAPEEQFALDAYARLRNDHPNLRLVIVPRHKERFEEVAALIERSGLGLRRRSAPASSLDRPVLLLDTLGELSACWGLADIAFVGGSLSNRGGQNMLEPAAYGAVVLFGPNTFNFRHAVELLLARDAALVVHDGIELRITVEQLLQNPLRRRQLGERAQALVLSQQGATERLTDLMNQFLPVTVAGTRQRAA